MELAKMSSNQENVIATIDPNEIRVRDQLMVQIINGVTKAGYHENKKKRASKYACRKPTSTDD
jgi:hypothetical protein